MMDSPREYASKSVDPYPDKSEVAPPRSMTDAAIDALGTNLLELDTAIRRLDGRLDAVLGPEHIEPVPDRGDVPEVRTSRLVAAIHAMSGDAKGYATRINNLVDRLEI